MNLEEHVWCPPTVQLSGDDRTAAFLLAWLRVERTAEWRAIVTYVHLTGHPPVLRRKVAEVSGHSLSPLEPPGAYRKVPRLVLGKDGAVRPWASRDDQGAGRG